MIVCNSYSCIGILSYYYCLTLLHNVHLVTKKSKLGVSFLNLIIPRGHFYSGDYDMKILG